MSFSYSQLYYITLHYITFSIIRRPMGYKLQRFRRTTQSMTTNKAHAKRMNEIMQVEYIVTVQKVRFSLNIIIKRRINV